MKSPLTAPEDAQRIQLDPWLWWREQMPVTQQFAYFDHAAVAPISGPARAAIRLFADQAAELGDTVWPDWSAEADRLRDDAAELIHCSADSIALIPNTTAGINLIAEGFPWRDGDNVVIPDHEFPSNLFPWLNQQSRGVQVRVVPTRDGAVNIDDLIAHVDSSTRLISASWVGYASGYRIDIDQLVARAHERGVLVFLDAIQGLGMYPLDVSQTPVDFLAADGHKWLLGPEGAGIAYIAPHHIDTLRCTNVGWNSVKNSFNYADPKLELRSTGQRFESGSLNMIGAAALNASLQLFLDVRRQHGATAIGDRVIDLAEILAESLRECGVTTRLSSAREHRSGIVNFDVPGREPAEIRRRALERGVVVSCRGGGVRASIHAYNNEADLERLLSVVREST